MKAIRQVTPYSRTDEAIAYIKRTKQYTFVLNLREGAFVRVTPDMPSYTDMFNQWLNKLVTLDYIGFDGSQLRVAVKEFPHKWFPIKYFDFNIHTKGKMRGESL